MMFSASLPHYSELFYDFQKLSGYHTQKIVSDTHMGKITSHPFVFLRGISVSLLTCSIYADFRHRVLVS